MIVNKSMRLGSILPSRIDFFRNKNQINDSEKLGSFSLLKFVFA